MKGGTKPLILNPAPEMLAWERVKFMLPELVRLIVCVLLLPTMTFPKLALVGMTESCGCSCIPVPLRAIVVGEFVAFVTSWRLPVTLPALVGTKTTLNAVC